MIVVDLDAFRQKRKKQEVVVQALKDEWVVSLEEMADKTRKAAPVSAKTTSDLDLFTREGMRFRFQNMRPPGMFVILHTEKLPPSFPPFNNNPLPPLVA
jgi:hypothetical protein